MITNQQAYDRVIKARTNLLLEHGFYGHLALRLNVEVDEHLSVNGQATMATDGTRLLAHPEFVEKLTDPELRGTVAHEVLHAALGHTYRLAVKEHPVIANIAADFVVNQIVLDSGLKLNGSPMTWDEIKKGTATRGYLYDERFDGMHFEQVYAIIMKEMPPQPQGGGSGKGKGKGQPEITTGEFRPAPNDPPKEYGDDKQDGQGQSEGQQQQPKPMSEEDWRIAAEQAHAMAKKAGTLSANLDRAIKASQQSTTDWRQILWRFAQEPVKHDYTFFPPNKRFIYRGDYLPRIQSEGLPGFPAGFDSSGSMSQRDQQVGANEITAILHELCPEFIDMVYVDSEVCNVERFTPEDACADLNLNAKGGGGTAFQPFFDWVAENYPEPPPFAIYFTDLYGDQPIDPGYPVLWITSASSSLKGPFGETVRINDWD